jgi:hypothetical protein
MAYTLRQVVGALLLDVPCFEWNLRHDWTRIRNRRERLLGEKGGRGAACTWQWTSDLYVAKVFPGLGARLLDRCLLDWPIAFAAQPIAASVEPAVSFIVGHRGRERIPHLLATLATLAAQRGVASECIVVEQSERAEAADLLPSWVRYVHTPLPATTMPYCRSWTLNVGARDARGQLLVFHDNDMLVPRTYAAELWARFREGHEVINLKRFVFYLGEACSRAILDGARDISGMAAEAIVQNLEAGGSVAMAREAFFAIGGFDESFVGWGGEDNEFWQRALVRKTWPYGYLPLVHLWHAPQPEKASRKPVGARSLREISMLPPERRIAALVRRKFGDSSRMDPPWRGQT